MAFGGPLASLQWSGSLNPFLTAKPKQVLLSAENQKRAEAESRFRLLLFCLMR